MNAMVACSALLSVLATAAAGSYDATTQRFRCSRIRAGDSAAEVAERLTGDSQRLWESSSQIFDSHRRPVSKARYNVIYPGWTACAAEWRSLAAIRTGSPVKPAASVQQPEPPVATQELFYDPVVWWFAWLALAAATSLFALNSWRKQRALAHHMGRFGADFVREF